MVYHIGKQDTIQKRCLKVITKKSHRGATVEELRVIYNHLKLADRKRTSSVSYVLLSLMQHNLDGLRPKIYLRNRDKAKFKVQCTILSKVQQNPFYREL